DALQRQLHPSPCAVPLRGKVAQSDRSDLRPGKANSLRTKKRYAFGRDRDAGPLAAPGAPREGQEQGRGRQQNVVRRGGKGDGRRRAQGQNETDAGANVVAAEGFGGIAHLGHGAGPILRRKRSEGVRHVTALWARVWAKN